MSVLQDDSIHYRQEKRHWDSSLTEDKLAENYSFSLNFDSTSRKRKHESFLDMLLRLKKVSVDPCNPRAALESLQNRILKVRKVLFFRNTECPWKMRKMHKYVQETSTVTSDLASTEANQHSHAGSSQGRYSLSSSVPYILNLDESTESYNQPIVLNAGSPVRLSNSYHNLPQRQVPIKPSFHQEIMDWTVPPDKNVPLLVVSDDSVNDSNPLGPEKPILQTPHRKREFPPENLVPLLIDSDDSVNDSMTLSADKQILRTPNRTTKGMKFVDNHPKKRAWPPDKAVPVLIDSDDSVNESNPSSAEKPNQVKIHKPRRSVRLSNFIGDYLPRLAIPIGHRFQVDMPEWTGPPNKENLYDSDSSSDNLRWLGTRIWPMEGKSIDSIETNRELIGKGRPDSCSCTSPGTASCIKCHIIEERLRLKSDLGLAFLDWRFDDMGEEVSKSWTVAKQRSFKSLVTMNPISRGKSFLELALKYFPSKCRQSMVSYYFNVFVLRRMSMRTRLASGVVDSDDDQGDDALHSKDSQIKRGARSRYLIQLR